MEEEDQWEVKPPQSPGGGSCGPTPDVGRHAPQRGDDAAPRHELPLRISVSSVVKSGLTTEGKDQWEVKPPQSPGGALAVPHRM
jgi:hypothetical protein